MSAAQVCVAIGFRSVQLVTAAIRPERVTAIQVRALLDPVLQICQDDPPKKKLV